VQAHVAQQVQAHSHQSPAQQRAVSCKPHVVLCCSEPLTLLLLTLLLLLLLKMLLPTLQLLLLLGSPEVPGRLAVLLLAVLLAQGACSSHPSTQ
jgi:hypothetical protein